MGYGLLLCFLHTIQCVYVCERDICRVESHVLHIPTCPALMAVRNGMLKLYAWSGKTTSKGAFVT